MTTTLHAAAWAICETSGPRCEELCPGCLEQAKAAGRVWLGAASKVAKGKRPAPDFQEPMLRLGYFCAGHEIAAAIEALIGEK